MKPRFARRFRGFSLLELVVVLTLALLLLAVALTYYGNLQRVAEQSAKNAVLQSLRVALALKASEMALYEGAAKVRMLEQENPFDLLSDQLSNYGGVIGSSVDLKPATWYYSRDSSELVYVERWVEGRLPLLVSPVIHRYRVSVRFGAGGADGVLIQSINSIDR